MNSIKLVSNKKFSGTTKDLKDKLNQNIEKYHNELSFANTEASLTWIIRGCIDYFDGLDSDFLGKENASGIPDMQADHFANNIYRIINAIDYLAKLWTINITKSDELNLLVDIRTLIVHSGEQLNQIKSLQLANYKDSQLGRIFSSKEHNPFQFRGDFSDMDYCIEIWNDKHDKTKKKHLSEVDYSIQNESYCDVSIYLKADDIREIMLLYISDFINGEDNDLKLKREVKKLPNIKGRVINEEQINFEKIANLISKDLRGGYVIETSKHYWNGFGLKRLLEYSNNRLDISDEVRDIISDRIQNVISKYWDDYQNNDILDDDLPNLDIRKVFADFTPEFEMKNYLEGQKLFIRIAPAFNTQDGDDATDIDYLGRFIKEAGIALGKQLDLEQTVDNMICHYFVQSIQNFIDK